MNFQSTTTPAGDRSVRAFLAIDLPDNIRGHVAGVTQRLAPFHRSLKIVAPESLHLTVRFLGAISRSRVADVVDAARSVEQMPAFALEISSLGSFPLSGAARRVFWAGLTQDGGYSSLQLLAARVEAELRRAGFPPESRPYAPHLTLARVRQDAPRGERATLAAEFDRLSGTFDSRWRFSVSEVTLFRSDTGAAGPRYTRLAGIPLCAI